MTEQIPILNLPPVFTSGGGTVVEENELDTGYVASAIDPDGDELIFAITGGEDQALFTLDGGALNFISAPDYELPSDADGDNEYLIKLSATDSNDSTASISLSIKVADDPEIPPNIVIFHIDDFAINEANFALSQSRQYTPTIDRLAEEGVIFNNYHVVTPVCGPSRYSLLTGNYASRSAAPEFLDTTEDQGMAVVRVHNTQITEEELTMPEVFQALGYVTGFTGKDHVAYRNNAISVPVDADPSDVEVQALLLSQQEAHHQDVEKIGFDYVASHYPRNPNEGLTALDAHNMEWITSGGVSFIEQYYQQPFFCIFLPR